MAEIDLDDIKKKKFKFHKIRNVETEVTKIVNDTKQLVVCSYPMRDLDRFHSFYLAAKATGRYLVIDFYSLLFIIIRRHLHHRVDQEHLPTSTLTLDSQINIKLRFN